MKLCQAHERKLTNDGHGIPLPHHTCWFLTTESRRDELTGLNRMRDEGGQPEKALAPLVQICFPELDVDSTTEAEGLRRTCLRNYTHKLREVYNCALMSQ